MNNEKANFIGATEVFSDEDAFSYIASLAASLPMEDFSMVRENGERAYLQAKEDYRPSEGDYELFVKNAILDGVLRLADARNKEKQARRDDSSLSQYYSEVGKYRMLTPQEEKLLGAQVKQSLKPDASEDEKKDGEIAKAALVNANLRLVVSIARDYSRDPIQLLDLIQEGNTGLIKAAERFDPDIGTRFSTYATPWIKQAIGKAAVEMNGAVQLPLGIANRISVIKRVSATLSQKFEREPTFEEIAAEIPNMDARSVAEMLSYSQSPKSINDPLKDDSDEEFIDTYMSPEGDEVSERIDTDERMMLLEKGISCLREDERTVIVHLYGINCDKKNLKEVATLLGKSPERIRQIREQALWRMRKQFEKED